MKRSSTGRYGVPAASALLILTGAALLAGCASPPSGTDNPTNAPPAATSGPGLPPSASTGLPGSPNPAPAISLPAGADIGLSIAVKAGPEDPAKATTLICNGSSPLPESSVSDPAAACAAVQKFGSAIFSPTVPNRQCTMQYGGPQTAQVTGTVKGQAVAKSFSLTDGCEISDWNSFAAVLGSPADSGL